MTSGVQEHPRCGRIGAAFGEGVDRFCGPGDVLLRDIVWGKYPYQHSQGPRWVLPGPEVSDGGIWRPQVVTVRVHDQRPHGRSGITISKGLAMVCGARKCGV